MAKQHRLNILIEAMKTYQPQYDGVDYISETIRHIVKLAQLDTPAAPEASASSIAEWTDILASQPGCYLRLAMTMDLSLSKGRLPEETDFPASLQGLFTAGYSSVKALMGTSKPVVPTTVPHSRYTAANFTHDPAVYANNVHLVPGTVQSLPSDADTDSPVSHHDPANHLLDPSGHDRYSGNSGSDQHMKMDELHTAEFLDAALEMEGLAGEVLAAYTLHNESPQSHSSSEGDATFYEDEDNSTEDWIGRAWGDEQAPSMDVEATKGDAGDQETARALLNAMRDGEVVDAAA
jgi:hypothetical protein